MNILVVYYSTYGHTFRLAQAEAEGAASVTGAEVRLVRVPELVPDEIISQNAGMLAGRDMQREVAVAQVGDMEWADGVAMGSPTRYGNMTSQMKNYIDQLGALWVKGAMEGKPATCFTSSSTMHGGQETTIVTMWIPLVHLGMLVLGVPYSLPEINTTQRGGSPYGASTVARQGLQAAGCPNDVEITIARAQGRRLAEATLKLRG